MEQKRMITIGVALIFLLGGGFWLWQRGKIDQKFENKPIDMEIIREPVPLENAPIETSPSTTHETPSIEVPVPPKGVSLDSSSAPTTSETEKISSLKMTPHFVSFGYEKATSRTIDTIVVHSSYNALGGDEFDNDGIFKEWKDAGVSPHYFIDRSGNVFQLVKENDIAWHAGASKTPDGRSDVNRFSIGIEMNGTKTSGYMSAQYASLNALIADIKSRHTIKYILGHDEIAPGRKTDPWAFDWSKVKK